MRLFIWVGALYYVALFFVVVSLTVTQVSAAGRTYKSRKDEEKPEYELCRLKELLREEEGNSCVYSRQSGGREVVIKIDDNVVCQSQFKCKKE
mgnify:FL=1